MSTVRRRPQKMTPTALKFKLPWGSRIQLQRHEIGRHWLVKVGRFL